MTKIEEAESFEEQFFWLNFEVSGRPTYVLSHRLLFRVGEASLIADRHYYASHDYNTCSKEPQRSQRRRAWSSLSQSALDRSDYGIWICGEAEHCSRYDDASP